MSCNFEGFRCFFTNTKAWISVMSSQLTFFHGFFFLAKKRDFYQVAMLSVEITHPITMKDNFEF